MTIYLGGQPGRSASRVIPSLFGLASGGVCPRRALRRRGVRSYRTISPLPRQAEAVCFCGTFHRVAPSPVAEGAVLYEVRTFLPDCSGPPPGQLREEDTLSRPWASQAMGVYFQITARLFALKIFFPLPMGTSSSTLFVASILNRSRCSTISKGPSVIGSRNFGSLT